MAIQKTLVIAQDETLRASLSQSLENDYDLEWAATVAEARQRSASDGWDLVLADGAVEDFETLTSPTKFPTGWPAIVVLASAGQRQWAAKAVQAGAFACVIKPFSAEELSATILRAAEHNRLTELCRRWAWGDEQALLGDSFAASQLRTLLPKVAQTAIPVLIRGQSGVGKELIARLIHRDGARSGGPFVKVDCATRAEADIEQALFGWSTWQANSRKRPEGALELAAGGTVFIDEISLLPASTQLQLLKTLQEQKFQRTDGGRWIALDARVIAATTREIEKEVERGAFNEQLFYVLNVVPVWVSPLKERPQDIRTLASSFARYYGRKHGAPADLSPEAITALEHGNWTGNVRQLRNIVEQAVVQAAISADPSRTITAAVITSCLPAVNRAWGSASADTAAQSSPGDVECLDEIEKRHILAILARCNGNRTLAAKRLGISIRTIRNKLKLYRSQPNLEVMQAA